MLARSWSLDPIGTAWLGVRASPELADTLRNSATSYSRRSGVSFTMPDTLPRGDTYSAPAKLATRFSVTMGAVGLHMTSTSLSLASITPSSWGNRTRTVAYPCGLEI
ncbi:hypothetical protein E2C01_025579 [Portunus trituberculatus]|uniref:Uncharacterized protein n=1 Tax=Portunus trituberculatus TaxID=210409 RepID=A0A5B7EDA2_PORTR|nr:hypothetical protein [Portunus trituberculatus]